MARKQTHKKFSALDGDLGRAQQRICNLAQLAAVQLSVEKLNALNITIAAYLSPEIYAQVKADLTTEQVAMGVMPIEPRSVVAIRSEILRFRKFKKISVNQIHIADKAIDGLTRELRNRQGTAGTAASRKR